MPFPVVPALAIGGSLLAQNLLNKKFDFTQPNEKDFVISDSQVSNTFNQILGDLSSVQQGQIAAIRQAGAANRLPAGATQARIAQTAETTARGAARALPALKENQRRSRVDFFNARNRVEQLNAQQQAAQQQFTQSGLGALGQILTLWQGGAFNTGGATGQQPQGFTPFVPGI